MNTSNQNITFKGAKLVIAGHLLKVGDTLPKYVLTANDMSDLSSDAFKGKPLVISVVPSLDTPVCSLQTKRFNQEAGKLATAVTVLTISRDTPFAQKRWCGAEGVTNVVTASDFKHRTFGQAFGVEIPDWGLLARAIFVSDSSGKIVHAEYVPEISAEPDYAAALGAVRSLL